MDKIETNLWAALARLKSGKPRNAKNRELLAKGTLPFSEASLAREAGNSRTTVNVNKIRFADLLGALADAEAARVDALARERQRAKMALDLPAQLRQARSIAVGAILERDRAVAALERELSKSAMRGRTRSTRPRFDA